MRAFWVQVNIPQSQIYAIKEGLPVAEASKEYEGQLLGISQKVLPRNDEGTRQVSHILLHWMSAACAEDICGVANFR